ncbi:N-acetylneuraminate synthase family protein [Desulfobacterota bacterium M19]
MFVQFNPARQIKFSNHKLGDGCPCFITFEAGPTHDSVDSAKSLVSLAAQAGANAIKFQIFDADRLVADKKQLFSYQVLVDKQSGKTETVEEPLYDILRRRQLSHPEWKEIKRLSDALGLAFFATVGFEEDLAFLENLDCDSVKIASADINHWPLIRRAAQTGMCIQLDTGNATLGEIEDAVDIIHHEGNERIIIHQCPSGYPAYLPSVNLRIIETLRQVFPYPVAYSDHTPGHDIDIAALAMGANLIEKTITLDRMTKSVEHMFSLEPDDMHNFIKRIRDVEEALGNPRRIMQKEELANRNKIRRSVFLTKDTPAGTMLKDLAIEFRRPGDGISPDQYEKMSTCVTKHSLKSGDKLMKVNICYT